jgi:hypothetical protein
MSPTPIVAKEKLVCQEGVLERVVMLGGTGHLIGHFMKVCRDEHISMMFCSWSYDIGYRMDPFTHRGRDRSRQPEPLSANTQSFRTRSFHGDHRTRACGEQITRRSSCRSLCRDYWNNLATIRLPYTRSPLHISIDTLRRPPTRHFLSVQYRSAPWLYRLIYRVSWPGMLATCPGRLVATDRFAHGAGF